MSPIDKNGKPSWWWRWRWYQNGHTYHVSADVRLLRLQRHLVNVSEYLCGVLRRQITLATKSQAAGRCYVRVDLQRDKGVERASEACLASGSDENVLESVPTKERAEGRGIARTQDMILVLLGGSTDHWIRSRLCLSRLHSQG